MKCDKCGQEEYGPAGPEGLGDRFEPVPFVIAMVIAVIGFVWIISIRG